jgi:hypothetical protein
MIPNVAELSQRFSQLVSLVSDIRQRLFAPAPDARLWNPDESCSPFQLETAASGADTLLARFTVPTGNRAVVRSILCGSTTGSLKSATRVTVIRGASDTTLHDGIIPTNGALTGVVENDGGTNLAGFAVMSGSVPRPVCFILESGTYQITKDAGATTVFFAMSGFLVPEKPKQLRQS